jgi:hypothetical protein
VTEHLAQGEALAARAAELAQQHKEAQRRMTALQHATDEAHAALGQEVLAELVTRYRELDGMAEAAQAAADQAQAARDALRDAVRATLTGGVDGTGEHGWPDLLAQAQGMLVSAAQLRARAETESKAASIRSAREAEEARAKELKRRESELLRVHINTVGGLSLT